MDISPSNNNLRQQRIQRNWRQLDVADQLGATLISVKRWERGSHYPSIYFRMKLCDLFGKSLEELGLLPEDPQSSDKEETEKAASPGENYSPCSACLWGIPFPRNPFFTGRGAILEHIHTMLTHKHTTASLTQSYALYGLGGIGKTQLAIEYAYQHRCDYDAILWVEAETHTTLISSFMTMAVLLALPEKTEQDQHKIVAAILRWLNGHERWLLIFDNVEDLSLLKPFLPASNQGVLLLTTRLHSLGTLAQRLEISPMTVKEGYTFLLARTNRLDQSEREASINPQEIAAAQQIVAEMGGLPLALEQAGAYIEATQCSLSEYLDLFRAAQHRLLDEHELSSTHSLSVSQTFTLAFERVEQRNPLAAALLTACAFLAPDAIPETFFQEGATSLGPPFEGQAADPLAFLEAIKVLLSYSLLQRHAITRTITVHRLVQAVLKGRLMATIQRDWAQRIIKTMNCLFPTDDLMQTDYLLICEQLLPHAQACLLLSNQTDVDEVFCLPLINHVATYLARRARYIEARQLLEDAVQKIEQIFGLEHPLGAEALHGLADIYRMLCQYTEAERLFEQAIRIREQTLGACHPLVATSLERLGKLYVHQGKYEQAEPHLQRSLHIFEQTLASEHLSITPLLNVLGVFAFEQGKYEQAESLFQRALYIFEQTAGPDHPRVAPTLNNLGNLYKQQGKYEQAEPYIQQALYIFEQTLGPDHSDVAFALNNLGNLYQELGKFEQAKLHYLRALHIFEQTLSPDHSDVASPLNGLGNLCLEQGEFEQAELFYQRALTIRQRHMGPKHPDVAETLHDLARLSQLQQQTTKALSLYQQALAIREQVLGQEHPKTQKTRYALTQLLEDSFRKGISYHT